LKITHDSHNCIVFHDSFIIGEEYNSSMSQAYDEGCDNLWYNALKEEGNYWSDLGTDSIYEISESANSTDLYPLDEPFL